MAYVPDDKLGYDRIRWQPLDGAQLELDATYRLAHLPLLKPDHPDVIAESPDGVYRSGKYAQKRFSLVLPVSYTDLEQSPAFCMVDEAIRSSGLSCKMAWEIMKRRRGLLHATISGGLCETDLPDIAALLEKHTDRHGLPSYRIGGPLIGQKNMGRIYLPVFPENRNGENSFHHLQDALGKPRTDIFLVGYYSLFDHLTVSETAELASILKRFSGSALLEATSEKLWLLATNDDLVLSGSVVFSINGR